MLGWLSALRWRAHAATMADQVLSSLSNVLAVVLGAKSTDAADFGRFSLAYTVLTVVVGLNRAYLGNRVSLSRDDEAAHRATALAAGGMVVLAPAVALVVWLVARVASGGGTLVVIVALAAPVVCVQDLLRFGAVASRRPSVALVSDAIWTACLVVPLLLTARPSPVQAVAIWAAGAVVSAVVAMAHFGIRPRIMAGWRSLREHDPVGRSLVVGRLLTSSASLLAISASAAIIGPVAAGSLRGASTLLGPLNGIFALIPLSLTPMLVRRPRSGDLRACVAIACTLLVLVLTMGGALLLLPPELGTRLLGDSWAGARAVLPFTVAEYCSISVTAALLLAAKVRGDARAISVQQAVLAVVVVVLGIAAAWLTHEARFVAAAFAVGSVASAATGAVTLVRDTRRVPAAATV